MAEQTIQPTGREAIGSQDNDAGDGSLARGAAGQQTGTHSSAGTHNHGGLIERRETQQVDVPTSDGMGEGLTKDRS